MSTLDWMDIIYPLTASGFAGYVVCKIAWRWIVRSWSGPLSPSVLRKVRRIVEADVLIGVSELAVLFLLGILTGNDPHFLGKPISIDDYRQYVTFTRFLMGVFLFYSVGIHVSALVLYIRQIGTA